MKIQTFLAIIAVFFCAKIAPIFAQAPTNTVQNLVTNIVLIIDNYPPEEMVAETEFHVWHSTNAFLPLNQWRHITNWPATTNTTVFPIRPGLNLFTVSVSNMWGHAPFSPVALAPALPRSNVNVRIIVPRVFP